MDTNRNISLTMFSAAESQATLVSISLFKLSVNHSNFLTYLLYMLAWRCSDNALYILFSKTVLLVIKCSLLFGSLSAYLGFKYINIHMPDTFLPQHWSKGECFHSAFSWLKFRGRSRGRRKFCQINLEKDDYYCIFISLLSELRSELLLTSEIELVAWSTKESSPNFFSNLKDKYGFLIE